MFPSQGYFSSLNCPHYLEGKCERIFCHFLHDRNLLNQTQILADSTHPTKIHVLEEKTQVMSAVLATIPSSKSEIQDPHSTSQSMSLTASKAATSTHLSNKGIIMPMTEYMCNKSDSDPLDTSSTQIENKGSFSEESTSSKNSTEFLQQLVQEAVKRVLSENASLSVALTNKNVMENLNAEELVARAVQGISSYSLNDKTLRERKQPKLYLPPPGTPAYKPTPISELKNKIQNTTNYVSLPVEEEYTPTPVTNILVNNEDSITDFSSDEDTGYSKSEFDMLEEVLVEKSSDPLRRKAILKRKKALGKLSAQSVSSPPVKKAKTSSDKADACGITLQNKSEISLDNPTESSFHPPSPIFTSSSSANEGISVLQKASQESNNDKVCSSEQTDKPSNNLSSDEMMEEGTKTVSEPPAVKTSSTHKFLPQIAQLSRPNIKTWSPVAKVESHLSVEKMLEQLDCLPSNDRNKQLSISNRIASLNSKVKDCSSEKTTIINNKLDSSVPSPALKSSEKIEVPNQLSSILIEENQLDTQQQGINSSSCENDKNFERTRQDSNQEINSDLKSGSEKSKHSNLQSNKSNEKKSKKSCNKNKKKGSENKNGQEDGHDTCVSSSEHSSDLEEKEHSCHQRRSNSHQRRSLYDDGSYNQDKKRKILGKNHSSRRSSRRRHKQRSLSLDEGTYSSASSEDGSSDYSGEKRKKYSKKRRKRRKHKSRSLHRKQSKSKHKRSKNSKRSKSSYRKKSYSSSSHESSYNCSPESGKRAGKENENSNHSEIIPISEKLIPASDIKNEKSDNEVNEVSAFNKNEKLDIEISTIKLEKDVNIKIKEERETGIKDKHEVTSTTSSTTNIINPSTNTTLSSTSSNISQKSSLSDMKSSKSSLVSDQRGAVGTQSTTSSQNKKIHDKFALPKENPIKQKDAVFVSSHSKKSGNSETPLSTKESTSRPKLLKEISIFEKLENSQKHSSSQKSSRDKDLKIKKVSKKHKEKNPTKASSITHHETCSESKESSSSKDKRSSSKDKLRHSHGSKDSGNRRGSSDSRSSSSKEESCLPTKTGNITQSDSKHLTSSKAGSSSKSKSEHSSVGSKDSRSRRVSSDSRPSSRKEKHHNDKSKSSSHRKSDTTEVSAIGAPVHKKCKEDLSKDKNSNKEKHRHRSSSSKEGTAAKHKHAIKVSLHLTDSEEPLPGCDSPIPDLSALDDLPKEDWDQLLSGSNDIPEDTDSDDQRDFEPLNSPDEEDVDEPNDPRVMEECLRVFSEFSPPEKIEHLPKKEPRRSIKEQPKADEVLCKPRVAHAGAAGNLIPKPKALVKPRRKTPAEVMLERYQKLKEEEEKLRKKLELQRKELERHGKLPVSGVVSSPSVSSTSEPSSEFSQGVSSTVPGLPKRRVARAPSNVTAMLQSKERLKTLNTKEKPVFMATATQRNPSTAATTNAKGTARVAHIPKMETLERPVVSTVDGTKVPQNIRQRYLNCFIDETLKFCDGEQHAFNVALAEEGICHKRATTRMVYLNLAVNILKKLRSFQISEAAQELLENDPKYENTADKSVSSPTITSPPTKMRFDRPVNPNHRTVSHFSVMASGGQKGSWSILKIKRTLPKDFQDYLTGPKFYQSLKKYILTSEQLDGNCFPRTDPYTKGKAILKQINSRKKLSPSESTRYCDRCSTLYEVDQWGLPVVLVSCAYHWGRPYKRRGFGGLETRYSCCQGDNESDGCCLATLHVSENFNPDALKGFVRTIPKESFSAGDYGVYALDCEMCYTTSGSELTRITVTDASCKPVYETFVKPDNPVIDYNTRFSGVTAEDLEDVTVTLREVQAALLTRFSDKTILIGHSLESDFTALKLIHDTVVDTSVVFPHKLGAPFKRALRNLASEYLSKIIQNDDGGHDSSEDAITCMELMHWRVKEDLKGHVIY